MGWSEEVQSHRIKVACRRAKQKVREQHDTAYLDKQLNAHGANVTNAAHFVAIAAAVAGAYLWQVEGRRLRGKNLSTLPIVGPLLKALTGNKSARPANPRQRAAQAAIQRQQVRVWNWRFATSCATNTGTASQGRSSCSQQRVDAGCAAIQTRAQAAAGRKQKEETPPQVKCHMYTLYYNNINRYISM